jgi:hypothetical protein
MSSGDYEIVINAKGNYQKDQPLPLGFMVTGLDKMPSAVIVNGKSVEFDWNNISKQAIVEIKHLRNTKIVLRKG